MWDRRRVIRIALAVLAAVVVVGLLGTAVVLWQASGDLTAGRDELQAGERALRSGHPEDAGGAFDSADRHFATAADDLDGPLASFAAALPGLGNHVEVARAAAEAGGASSDAGARLAGAFAALPDGIGDLAPDGGRLPLERYDDVASATEAASLDAARALDAIERAPTTWLLPPVLDARWDAESDVRATVRALDAATALLRGLPAFAGGDGPRRYLVVSENPAELRGTGGLWGAYAVLTFRDGRATIGAAAPTGSLPQVSADAIDPPNPDYRRNYDQFGGAASWQNMNMTPDFPSAARAAIGNWEAGGGTVLNGVIAADPFALEHMLRVTGPTAIPGTDLTIDADEVVAFTTNGAYAVFTNPGDRKELLGEVAAGVFERFLSMQGRAAARVRAIGAAVSGGHLKLYVDDAGVQEGFELAGAAGSLATGPGDIIAVHVNNGSANKVDVWAARRLEYDVQLGGDGEALATLETTIENGAPTDGFPPYVLGPRVEELGPGDQLPLITVSCHEPCELVEGRRDGEPVAVEAGRELGVPWYRDYRAISAGDEGALQLTWRTEGVWEGTGADGRYRLTIVGQTTIAPTDTRVTIQAPTGADVIWTNLPMTVEGGVATWRGTPGPRTVLEVRFRAPIPLRWWRDLTGSLVGSSVG